jgi:hypothetical protein
MRDDGKSERGAPSVSRAACRRKDFISIGKVISESAREVILEGLMSGERTTWLLIESKLKTKWYEKQ